ncbi:MAG: type II toxin-antitoxin system Y4mF family antitoxin [Ignavibacteria bacterium]|jgi:y4mF family transcriptional regulator
MNILGKIIKNHRKKAGLTQKELADLAGIGKTVIFDIEKGKKTVQFNSLLKVLDVLNIKLKIESRLMEQEAVINEKS